VRRGRETEQAQVPLHLAASVVHQQLSGAANAREVENYGGVLNSTALALSSVSEIWYLDSRGRLVKIPEEELAVGGFEGGAKLFRTRSGNVYESLSIRRADMADALAILKNASSAE
jgi:hypothetical protein